MNQIFSNSLDTLHKFQHSSSETNHEEGDNKMSEDKSSCQSEIRTRRLVVVDDSGAERIIAEVANGQAELRVALSERGQPSTGALLYAAPNAGDIDLGPMLGLQLRADGNAYVEVNLSKEDDRWVPRIYSGNPDE